MAVNWDSNVNTRVLRIGTDWNEPETIIEDKTRSGKPKRRLAYSSEPRKFNVAFKFTTSEYDSFRTWFRDYLRKGMNSFNFPKVDSVDKTTMQEYQIAKGGFPKYSNESGKIIKCTMVWEEV